MKSTKPIITNQSLFHNKKQAPPCLKKIWLHRLAWVLLAAALFYGLHRYFEYRERELDKRLEQLSSKSTKATGRPSPDFR